MGCAGVVGLGPFDLLPGEARFVVYLLWEEVEPAVLWHLGRPFVFVLAEVTLAEV